MFEVFAQSSNQNIDRYKGVQRGGAGIYPLKNKFLSRNSSNLPLHFRKTPSKYVTRRPWIVTVDWNL